MKQPFNTLQPLDPDAVSRAAATPALAESGSKAMRSLSLDASPRQAAQRMQLQGLFGVVGVGGEGGGGGGDAADAVRPHENRTGLPDALKAGLESISGLDLSDVRVRTASSQPAKMGALAFAQGHQIHIAPGQEQHLAHEAWHVVQQRQGRVKATATVAGTPVNADAGLEAEADRMGARALQMHGPSTAGSTAPAASPGAPAAPNSAPMQFKGWVWNAKERRWEEFDAAERGKKVPAGIEGAQNEHGVVYDADTGNWYRTREQYRAATAPVLQGPFVLDAMQDDDERHRLRVSQDAQRPLFRGASERLGGFLEQGVRLPRNLGAAVAKSADEKPRDTISANRFESKSSREAEAITRYATANEANGAIPVVLENAADRLAEDRQADPDALADRAHHSALAVIDASRLPQPLQRNLKQSTGDGEVSLEGEIPASCFVAVLVPIHLERCVTAEQVQRLHVIFVGSVPGEFRFNFKTTEGGRGYSVPKVLAPDYRSALLRILSANPGRMILTHVVRLSPPEPVRTLSLDAARPSADAGLDQDRDRDRDHDSDRESDHDSDRESDRDLRPGLSASMESQALSPPASGPTIARRTADAVFAHYDGLHRNDADAARAHYRQEVPDVQALQASFAHLGVDEANLHQVFKILAQEGYWYL